MLLKDDCEVVLAASVDEGLAALAAAPADLVMLDLVMPGRSGIDLLTELAERGAMPPVIVLSATRTIATAVEAMKLGAADYVTKPFEAGALRIKVQRLLAGRDLEREVIRLREGRALAAATGSSDAATACKRFAHERVAQSRATALVTGESGTGKELVSRALHELGPRRELPFVSINCASIPDALIESELFGHERGAFTDARERRIGRFEAASGGTLFLDEVGELSAAVQAKLLRTLQERSIERLGGSGPIAVDVRLVAATNRDLDAEVAAGRFRADLFYRIHVVPTALPPLRERRDDIRLLAEEFLARACRDAGRGPARIDPAALAALERYAWPGNVRELGNAIERAVALVDGDVIALDDLPPKLVRADRVAQLQDAVRAGRIGLDDALARFESALILEALEHAAWNQTRAADALSITRRLLKLKMDRLGLAPAGGSADVPPGTAAQSDDVAGTSPRPLDI